METPPFQETMWQNAQLQELLKAGKKPGLPPPCAPGMGSCPPVNNPHICQHLHHVCDVNAHHPPQTKINFKPPCAGEILALFGCGKPKPPEKPPPPPPPPLPQHPIPIPKKKPPKEEKKKEDDKPPPKNDKPPPKDDKPPPKEEKPPKEGEKKEKYPLADLVDNTTNNKDQLHDIMAAQSKSTVKNKQLHRDAKEEGTVGLMNEQQSLALMTAIGSDLEKTLKSKFHDTSTTKSKEGNNVAAKIVEGNSDLTSLFKSSDDGSGSGDAQDTKGNVFVQMFQFKYIQCITLQKVNFDT